MTTAQVDELWAAHCDTVNAAITMSRARTREARDKASEEYRTSERRFYLTWVAALRESDPDPVAESLDAEAEAMEVGHG